MTGTRQFITAVMLGLLVVAVTPLWPDSDRSTTLWITSDIQGYLVGCDCPTGSSAGVSALAVLLENERRPGDLLLDSGGFRESGRSDALLEEYMDGAARSLGYDGMIAVAADLRDGGKEYTSRAGGLPLSVAAGVEDPRFLRKLYGSEAVLRLETGAVSVSVASLPVSDDPADAAVFDLREFRVRSIPEVIDSLAGAEADFRVLSVRGGLENLPPSESLLDNGTELPGLIVFTGPASPGAQLAAGGVQGSLEAGEGMIPWLSLAPRGNGLAAVRISDSGDTAVRILELERGVSPESSAVLDMGESYMNDLVDAALRAAGRPAPSAGDGEALEAEYWYPYGCRDCEDFLWETVPRLERDTGRRILIKEWNTSDPDEFEELTHRLEDTGTGLVAVPVMIIGDTVLQGDDAIKSGLADAAAVTGSGTDEQRPSGPQSTGVRWEPGAVFLAGLLDGVNPCAFSAMVFLVSALALAGRRRKTMLAIGLFYAFGVFITYSLIGAGLLGGLRQLAVESGLRAILEYILAGILALLSVLSLVDGIRLSKGRSDLILKLPEKLSVRVHGIIRENVRSGAAAGGALLLGAAVALIELGCTGQVYLPTIAWMISRGDGGTPWLWLAIYNCAFIIPLLVVFVISYRGVTATRLAAAFRRKGALVKYATALLFAVLAIVVIVA